MKAIIIDDEQRARILLTDMLKQFCPEVQVLLDCEDLPTGVKAIRKLKPQVVFLDIEMPGHSGLELLDFFDENEINFDIIFTTAYNQYAITAFKMSATDYLLKPISPEDLEGAIRRLNKKIEMKEISDYSVLKENLHTGVASRISVPVGNSYKFLQVDEIIFFKADSSYTEIILKDDSKLIVSRTLKNFEEILANDSRFLRSHKSYLINKNYITEYIKSDGGSIVLNNKYHTSSSPEKIQEFLENINLVKR